ncbi:MAG: hypothetical protein WA085_10560 [Sphingobium sp.]|nr:hypothetical protein [Sphingobium sp. CECT 9361]
MPTIETPAAARPAALFDVGGYGAGAAMQFATLTDGIAMTHAEFAIV